MKKYYYLLTCSFFVFTASFAQTKFPPVSVSQGTYLGETIALRDFETIIPTNGIPKNIIEIPNNLHVANRSSYNSISGEDPLKQTLVPFRYQPPIENFDGIALNESGGFIPPDPTGAVGPNHYVNAVNIAIKIFDKSGNLLAGPTNLSAFLGVGGGNGDPIIMYDRLADRWFVSQFRIGDNALIIGLSTTPDPTGTYDTWVFSLNFFPDYPHYAVWPNAYFMVANKTAQVTYALERDVMLAGGTNPQIIGFSLPGLIRNPNTVFGPQPANLLGDTYPDDVPGYIVYLQDDAWGGVATDHLKVYELDIDWETTGNSTVSAPLEIPTTSFDSFLFPFGSGDISQPGTGQRIDGITGVISYMSNYRSFPTYNSFLLNFNVDIGSTTSGIRWIELRNVGNGPFSIYQEGTWTIADGDSRFMGSIVMDEFGNIGLAYNVGSSSTNAAIRYTGRMDGDPLGTMTIAETSIIEGPSVQTFSNRFGDYAQLTIDIDNRTFWHTSQYFSSINFWRTRIASFKFASDFVDDVGVYNFVTPGFSGPYTSSETVEVSIYNFGTDSQSNFDIELLVDGNSVATETYTGTLTPGSSDTFTFTQTIDIGNDGQTYTVEARTLLGGDASPSNDNYERDYLFEILSVGDLEFNNSDLLIYPVSDKVYEINFVTNKDYGDISYEIYNILSQKLFSGIMINYANSYKTTVDMGSSSIGVYIVKISNGTFSTSKRVLVK